MWAYLKHILEVEPTGFMASLDKGHEKEAESRMIPRYFVFSRFYYYSFTLLQA
jgi:hypothetical protein